MILLCAATSFEIQPTLDWLQQHPGRVEVLITGVGLMETAWTLATRLASGPRPERMVQAGIAGCLDPSCPLGRVVSISHDRIGDLGVSEAGRFRSVFELGFGDPDRAPWQEGWLVNPGLFASPQQLPTAMAVSVNEVTTDTLRAAYYRKQGALAESMEGAAFHFAALKAGIPFAQLRSFSNYVGERDKSRWQLPQSIAALNRHLSTLLLQPDWQ